MKQLFKDFFKNLKDYVSYLMKVNFKELFVNTIILVCILVLSTFAYVPVGLLDDLIFNFIKIFVTMPVLVTQIYHWIFNLLGFVLALCAFAYMFNLRFKDVKEKGLDNKVEITKKGESKVTLDLPKQKDK